MRLTTDTPKNNIEMALNLFYVKDKEVWVRGYGKNGHGILKEWTEYEFQQEKTGSGLCEV